MYAKLSLRYNSKWLAILLEPIVMDSYLTRFLPFYFSTNVFATVGVWLLSHNFIYKHIWIFHFVVYYTKLYKVAYVTQIWFDVIFYKQIFNLSFEIINLRACIYICMYFFTFLTYFIVSMRNCCMSQKFESDFY